MTLDPQVEAVLAWVARAGGPPFWQLTTAEARARHEQSVLLDAPPAPVFRVDDRTVPGPAGEIPVRIYTPVESAAARPVLVWLHGGGHVVGSLAVYDSLCRRFALYAGCIVLAVDYRLAPEHKFPAAFDDACAALDWTVRHAASIGADPTRIALGGDSAGGNLAAAATIAARDRGQPGPAFQLLIYPALASRPEFPSHTTYADGFLLDRRTIDWFQNHYIASPADRDDPRFAPLNTADLGGLPDTLLVLAECDPLHDEGAAYAVRLRAAGVPTEVIDYPGMIHGFITMAGFIDTADVAARQIGDRLKQAFTGTLQSGAST